MRREEHECILVDTREHQAHAGECQNSSYSLLVAHEPASSVGYIQVGNVADLQEAAEGSTGNTKVEGIKVVVCTCTDSRTRKMFIAPTRNRPPLAGL